MVTTNVGAPSPTATSAPTTTPAPDATPPTTAATTLAPTTSSPRSPTTTRPSPPAQDHPVAAQPTSPVAIESTYNVVVPGGLELDVFAPAEPGPWPVAVTVHGGSWLSGDRGDLEGFARGLARTGVVVFNAEYSPLDEGGVFPQMFEEIACALALAQQSGVDHGGTNEVALVGYSAGAHISAVVAMAPDRFDDACIGELEPTETFVGISGPYDSDQFPFLALQFGGLLTDEPDAWANGNPYTYVGNNETMSALLLHGGVDPIVNPEFSRDFAARLTEANYRVDVVEFPGVGHFTIVDVNDNGADTVAAASAHVWANIGP